MKFGEKFARLVKDKGWSMNRAISAIEQWETTVYRWMKDDKSSPTMKDLNNIARVFEVDVNWLIDDRLGWEDKPTYNAETWLFVQAIQMVNELGPQEALRRMKAGGKTVGGGITVKTPGAIATPMPKGSATDEPKRKKSS
jgi:transcriptional regulator with XRE-family HTH domain